MFVILLPLLKKPVLRLDRHRYYRRFPRYFPIIESIFSAASAALVLSDLRYNNPVTYKAHSLNPGLNIISDRRRNRAISPDIKVSLVFFEQLELPRSLIHFFRRLRSLVADYYII
jgi:hypothetical protein